MFFQQANGIFIHHFQVHLRTKQVADVVDAVLDHRWAEIRRDVITESYVLIRIFNAHISILRLQQLTVRYSSTKRWSGSTAKVVSNRHPTSFPSRTKRELLRFSFPAKTRHSHKLSRQKAFSTSTKLAPRLQRTETICVWVRTAAIKDACAHNNFTTHKTASDTHNALFVRLCYYYVNCYS